MDFQMAMVLSSESLTCDAESLREASTSSNRRISDFVSSETRPSSGIVYCDDLISKKWI